MPEVIKSYCVFPIERACVREITKEKVFFHMKCCRSRGTRENIVIITQESVKFALMTRLLTIVYCVGVFFFCRCEILFAQTCHNETIMRNGHKNQSKVLCSVFGVVSKNANIVNDL